MKTAKTLLALLTATLLTLLVCGKDHGSQGNAKVHGNKKAASHATSGGAATTARSETGKNGSDVKLVFSEQERNVIQNYVKSYSGGSEKKQKSLPPGLAKKVDRGGDLPPGWQKKVAPGEVMAPEVMKVAVPLPKELVLKLPPSPIGTVTVAVEGKVVRMMEKTRQILDILELP